MSEEKANQKEILKIPAERVLKFFPKDYTAAQMEEESGGTVYDVTGVFDQTVDKSLLRQFQDIILSQEET